MDHDFLVERDLEYACHDGESLKGWLWRPSTPGPHPVLIAIPGGAWRQGGPEKFKDWGAWLAARGWAVFSVSYRFASAKQKSWPESFLDLRAAVQFIKGRARELDLHPARVSLFGDSAGGHLAALLALAGEEEPFRSTFPADPFHRLTTEVRCVIGVYGI